MDRSLKQNRALSLNGLVEIVFLIPALLLGVATPGAFARELPPIDMAFISGNQKKAVALLQQSLSIDGKMSDGTPFIVEASRRSLVDVLRHLISSGADVTRKGKDGSNALQVAARYEADESLPLLLGAKVFDINEPDQEGYAPLHYASTSRPKVIEMLVEAGADPNQGTRNAARLTPLERAAERGFASNVSTLLALGAKAEGEIGSRAVKWASSYNTDDHAEVILSLAKAGANLDGEPVWKCLENKRYKSLAALLKGGANVNQRGKNKMTPLICAVAISQDIRSVRLILQFKPDLEAKAHFPFAFHGVSALPIEEHYNDATALMCAAQSGRIDIVRHLTAAGADPLAENRHGKSAIDLAAQAKKAEIVSFLAKLSRAVPTS